jgi:hypothetical protein
MRRRSANRRMIRRRWCSSSRSRVAEEVRLHRTAAVLPDSLGLHRLAPGGSLGVRHVTDKWTIETIRPPANKKRSGFADGRLLHFSGLLHRFVETCSVPERITDGNWICHEFSRHELGENFVVERKMIVEISVNSRLFH